MRSDFSDAIRYASLVEKKPSDALQRYLELYKQLAAMPDLESDEADALRDEMDQPWWQMTEEERVKFHEYVVSDGTT